MASLTSWTRLEPVTGRKDIEVGLQAPVHDPLWMLARQWQVGEFRAEDAGSPVVARLRAEVTRVTRYRAGPLASDTGAASSRDYDSSGPLEAFVEREAAAPAADSRPHLRLSAEAGLHFLSMLARQGMTKYRDAVVRNFPFGRLAGADDDDESRAFEIVVSRRVPDGVRLFEALRVARRPVEGPPRLPSGLPIDATDVETVGAVADAFLLSYEQLVSRPRRDDLAAWIPERMEYAFALAAPGSDGERVLVAREYFEGSLDWHAFDESGGASLGATPTQSSPALVVRTVIPTPVSYRGMPATRWWEFEDAIVDFGSVEVPPSDLTRLLMLDFLVSFSNDWFIMPVELEVGSICTAQSLVVIDTFGERTLIPHYTKVDGAAGRWHLFRITTDPHSTPPQPTSGSRLFMAPTLCGSLSGPAVEEVLLLRDELANLAFGVERIVEGSAGQPVNRFEEFQAAQRRREELDSQSGAQKPDSGSVFRYGLARSIPDHWIPLVPVRDENTRSIRLKRGRLLSGKDGGTALPMPRGRLLEPGKPLILFEEEIPRSGVKVTRAWQLARWVDGSTHLWVGRRKQPGRGEGSSGLRFDVLDAGSPAKDQ